MTDNSAAQLRKEAQRARALAENMSPAEALNLLRIARSMEREADALEIALNRARDARTAGARTVNEGEDP